MRAILVTMVAAAALVCVGLLAEGDRKSEIGSRPIAAASVAPTSDLRPPTSDAPDLLEERIFHLPEDSLIWYTTVVYPDNRESDAASRKVAAWFASDPRLASLTKQTRFNEVTTKNELYAAHYSGQGQLPIVWLQRGKDGQRIYKASGDNLPATGKQLADEIAKAIAEQCPCRPHRPQPGPRPGPEPRPQPEPGPSVPSDPSIEPIPDLRPVDDEGGGDGEPVELPVWAYGLIPLVCVVLAVLYESHRRRG